jgi:hypothetical protein
MINYIDCFKRFIKYYRSNGPLNNNIDFYKKRLIINNVDNENIVDGMLTISLPKDVLRNVSNILLMSE